ncbi:hypothetical protein CL617_00845 [archaeon]|nr:hypothetical protein [archaeon]
MFSYAAYLNFSDNSELNNFRQSLGENQIAVTNLYKNYELDVLNKEIILNYAIDKANKKFFQNSAILQSCNNLWSFSSNCEPNFEQNYIDLLKEELEFYNTEADSIKIENNDLIVNFGSLEFKTKNEVIDATYSNEATITKIPLDFTKLNSIKSELRSCILNNKLKTCFENQQENNNILTINTDIKTTYFLNNKVETSNFNFKIDTKNTGLNSLF